ncbi:MAG: biotin--[acetyl-CoA-carboxylase] ligase [Caldicoprobacterales bacterium]|jgi:BirA family biotin operon repressor/biotin-[acetyl-CoA-carboxylase] ligase
MIKERILGILLKNKETFISGEEISHKLGVSRTAVWKSIGKLRDEGFEVESVPNKGYRLIKPPDLLIPAVVKNALRTRQFGQIIEYCHSIDSTNTRAKELAQEGAAHGTLVIAEEQLKGKGRLGRSWESPAGLGIWMSLIARPSFPPQYAPRMTVLAGLAVKEAIHRVLGLKAEIKWPNDIILNARKVCGILTEMQADPDRIEYVVTGIGVNVNTPEEVFPEELRGSATSLIIETGNENPDRKIDRCRLLAEIISVFEELYDSWVEGGDFSALMQDYKESCVTLGRQVRVTGIDETFLGTAVDLTEDCRLVVQLPDGTRKTVYSGDVSVRGIAGYV